MITCHGLHTGMIEEGVIRQHPETALGVTRLTRVTRVRCLCHTRHTHTRTRTHVHTYTRIPSTRGRVWRPPAARPSTRPPPAPARGAPAPCTCATRQPPRRTTQRGVHRAFTYRRVAYNGLAKCTRMRRTRRRRRAVATRGKTGVEVHYRRWASGDARGTSPRPAACASAHVAHHTFHQKARTSALACGPLGLLPAVPASPHLVPFPTPTHTHPPAALGLHHVSTPRARRQLQPLCAPRSWAPASRRPKKDRDFLCELLYVHLITEAIDLHTPEGHRDPCREPPPPGAFHKHYLLQLTLPALR